MKNDIKRYNVLYINNIQFISGIYLILKKLSPSYQQLLCCRLFLPLLPQSFTLNMPGIIYFFPFLLCRNKKRRYFCRRRNGRAVECGGLENRCSPYGEPGVRIPLSPHRAKVRNWGFCLFLLRGFEPRNTSEQFLLPPQEMVEFFSPLLFGRSCL